MAKDYDILLKNGTVVDYATDREGLYDVAIADGKIAEICTNLPITQAEEVIDAAGCTIIPGIIDLHTHVSAWLGGRCGHKMLALAGVTTALDMAGPIESVLDTASKYGAGLNIATIEYVRPGHTVSSAQADNGELYALIDRCLTQGGLGIKLLGGHYPLTPSATARAIEAANRKKAYVAFHAGTTNSGSNLDGFLEAVELAQGNSLHIAHVNSYCRGAVRPYMTETEEAIAALTNNPNIRTEAYLSPMNGTSGKCSSGQPESLVTRRCLTTGGFAPTQDGFEQAVLAGWAQINMEVGGQVILATGKEAALYWRSKGTDAAVSFSVNPAEPRVRLASAKRPDGSFVVDCISTDGGGIPRNVIVDMGLSLVKLQALSMKEFVQKVSYNPAQILGLANKGHFCKGADADITVIDTNRQRPVMAMVNGQVIMHQGYVCGRGSQIITTERGVDYVQRKGLKPIIVDLADSAFYQKR